jgi:hypothetical protein
MDVSVATSTIFARREFLILAMKVTSHYTVQNACTRDA